MDTRLNAIWLTPYGFNDIDLDPYGSIYELIYKNLLNERYNFGHPKYEYIYLNIGALGLLPQPDTPSEYLTTVEIEFDIDDYKLANEPTKELMIINLYADGLTKIALSAGMDCTAINNVRDIALQYRAKTLLNIKNINTEKYSLKISIPAVSWMQEEPVYLSFQQKSSGRKKTICVGTAKLIEAAIWLQKVTVSSKTIRITSSTSGRFTELLKNYPSKLEYNIEDLLSGRVGES